MADRSAEAVSTAQSSLLVCRQCRAPMEAGRGGGRGRKQFCDDHCRGLFHQETRRATREAVRMSLVSLLDQLDQLRAQVKGAIDRVDAS